MAIKENKVTGLKYRVWDTAKDAWQRFSYWTHAKDVEFEDGTTAQDKLGNIKGVTTNKKEELDGYVVDATTLDNVAFVSKDAPSETDKIVRDSDLLGGHDENYFATKKSVDNLNSSLNWSIDTEIPIGKLGSLNMYRTIMRATVSDFYNNSQLVGTLPSNVSSIFVEAFWIQPPNASRTYGDGIKVNTPYNTTEIRISQSISQNITVPQ